MHGAEPLQRVAAPWPGLSESPPKFGGCREEQGEHQKARQTEGRADGKKDAEDFGSIPATAARRGVCEGACNLERFIFSRHKSHPVVPLTNQA